MAKNFLISDYDGTYQMKPMLPEELKRNIYISERVKPLNEQIYYLVDNINTAINKGKQIETETDKVPLNHMSSHIMGRVVKYQYLQGEGNAVNGHTEYVLEFEPLYSESNIELYIELKSGEKISIPLDLKCVD